MTVIDHKVSCNLFDLQFLRLLMSSARATIVLLFGERGSSDTSGPSGHAKLRRHVLSQSQAEDFRTVAESVARAANKSLDRSNGRRISHHHWVRSNVRNCRPRVDSTLCA